MLHPSVFPKRRIIIVELKKWSSHLLDNLSDCLINAPEKFQVSSTGFKPIPSANYADVVLLPTELIWSLSDVSRSICWASSCVSVKGNSSLNLTSQNISFNNHCVHMLSLSKKKNIVIVFLVRRRNNKGIRSDIKCGFLRLILHWSKDRYKVPVIQGIMWSMQEIMRYGALCVTLPNSVDSLYVVLSRYAGVQNFPCLQNFQTSFMLHFAMFQLC